MSMDLESVPGVGEKTARALAQLDEPERALREGDVATLSRAPDISPGRAARIARGAIRARHDDPGGFTATDRARELYREILELLQERAVTEYGRRRLETLYPSASRSRIEEVRELVETALKRDPDPAVASALSGVQPLEPARDVRVRERCLATGDADRYAEATDAVPELSVELVEDTRQLADLARGYSTVVALDGEFAGADLPGDVRVEPDALEEPVSVVPERTLAFFARNRDRLLAAADVHREADLEQPCDLEALEAALGAIDADGAVRNDEELDRLNRALEDLDALVSEAEQVANTHLREAIEARDVTIDGTDLLSLAERGAGVDSLLERELEAEYETAIERARETLVEGLSLEDTADRARRAFSEELGYPVEHDERTIQRLREQLRSRRDRRAARRKQTTAERLAELRPACERLVRTALELDVELAIARFAREFDCTMPELGGEGVTIEGGTSPLLDVPFEAVEPVEYAFDDVRLLSGVNSGGKTSLLDLVSLVVTLAHMGLPVPADRCRVGRIDELHYHEKSSGTLDAGAFEATVREFGELVTGVSGDRRVLVLVDELESITEPGASARIVAGILEALAARDASAVFVSHLAREIRAAATREIPVDGIQAHGLEEGELVVERSPVTGTLARSTPELIVEKLATDDSTDDEFYDSLLEKF